MFFVNWSWKLFYNEHVNMMFFSFKLWSTNKYKPWDAGHWWQYWWIMPGFIEVHCSFIFRSLYLYLWIVIGVCGDLGGHLQKSTLAKSLQYRLNSVVYFQIRANKFSEKYLINNSNKSRKVWWLEHTFLQSYQQLHNVYQK